MSEQYPSTVPESRFDHPCQARSKATGKPCGRAAVPGATVCRYHGGAAPQVKRKAAMRLLELVDPAIATLARTMADANAPYAARIRAAENVLDRAGVPRKVDVTETEAAKALLIERLIALRDQTPEEGQSPAEQVHQIVSGTVIPEQEQEEGEDA